MPALFCIGPLVALACWPVGEAPQAVTVQCPPVVGWSAADQKAAADALRGLPAGHPLRKMAVVTVKQRDIVRACRG